ncbi:MULTISPECIES: protein adenylyltransferase SelO [unclassified Polaribacter]|uniref:protein adenylyltransferase SelO n=1 Tax=unclassified Polaribacter TaxID=196858 RepID=UPI0011BDC596|nr:MULTISPECIES: YdiU family protein [unclassified Polaribacter]TXD52687.1 YdiU family protein [Polaribacter sp. IC063]TXD60655.1 YdiU family protein [Polaribacter sp. IC066]
MKLTIRETFTKNLPDDKTLENSRRQVTEAVFSFVTPKKTTAPKVLHISKEMASELDIPEEETNSEFFKNIVTGNEIYPDTTPFAMCYGGHQFGNWAGQLGDGRAINLFEVEHNKKNWKVQLKGAGETPYSRTADGLAVLRSSVREYLCAEAMFHLGVPTTRSLSLSLSGDTVLRDVLYDGNPAYEKGAIVSRVSPSFLRFGNYEIFAARKDIKNLKVLTDYTIKHHFPHLGEPSKETYINFFKEVSERTLAMIIHWQRVGFVHGVMNTDNMSILGLTIDFGPYGWLEGFDFGWTPNTTDIQNKRYRFGNQPNIGLWNLYQLANALYPIIEEVKPLEEILDQYKVDFEQQSFAMMKSKLGLYTSDENDLELIQNLEDTLQLTETDMTIFFRKLSSFSDKKSGFYLIEKAFYELEDPSDVIKMKWLHWFEKYSERLQKETTSSEERKEKMDAVNPKYVLRNYMSQLAIDAADKGDYSLIDELYQLLKKPYAEQPEYEKWFAKRPEWARNKVGCSMLSCSS